MTRIYDSAQRRSGVGIRSPVDETKCRAEVVNGYHSHQCNRRATVFEDVPLNAGIINVRKARGEKPPKLKTENLGFCKQHAPSEQRKRDEAKEKKWKEDWDRSKRAHEIKGARRDLMNALLKLPEEQWMEDLPIKLRNLYRKIKKLEAQQ